MADRVGLAGPSFGAAVNTPITFIVPGYPTPTQPPGQRSRAAGEAGPREHGTVKHSVTVAARRAEGGEVRATAVPGQDIVILQLENGLSLTLHPENARDLILAQSGVTRAGRAADADVQVPPSFRWRSLEQTVPTRSAISWLGGLALKGFEVVSDAAASLSDAAKNLVFGQVEDRAQEWVAGKLVDYFDQPGAVRNDAAKDREGVYALSRDSLPDSFTPTRKVKEIPAERGEKVLVLVHGTFSSTSGTFGKLWTKHPTLVETLFSSADGASDTRGYGSHVYALDHLTLARSPIENALTLARTLPPGVPVHLVTHSRGGLVAEALVRASAGDAGLGVFGDSTYQAHRAHAEELVALVRDRKLVFERVVRVACPARGTLLASKRLDAYLSVLKWTLDYAGIAPLAQLIGFLNGVAQYRVEPDMIPGLAAQVPGNPFVQWLHSVDSPVDGELRVISGDIAGESVLSWIKTLLSDAYYWTDNDFVVQTSSMYGGTRRQRSSTFQLDRGGDVSHFAYFANEDSAKAIVDALTADTPAGFQVIGRESYQGRDSSGVRAGAPQPEGDAAPAGPDPQRPAVIVVPGVFGSHLKDARGRRVWLNWEAATPIAQLAGSGALDPDGLVESLYAPLLRTLEASHDLIGFAYDWRLAIETSARALAERLDAALQARDATGTPVRIVAHSSGGLIVRAVQWVAPEVWRRWLSHAEARLLLLGTPNHGLWAPMQLMSGDDTLGGALTYLTAPFRDDESRRILAGLPGVMQLQAGLLDDPALQDPARWRKLAGDDVARAAAASTWHATDDQLRVFKWGVPDDDETFRDLLSGAADLHRRLAAQRDKELAAYARQILLVTGQASLTPYGYSEGADAGGFAYLYTSAGDGYATHASAALPGVDAWTVDAPHDKLATLPAAIDGYVELLQRGKTSRLQAATPTQTRGATRAGGEAAPAGVRLRPARTPKRTPPPGGGDRLFGATSEDHASLRDPATLRVTIVNGDLSFVPTALVLGHYQSSILTGTERVMDRLIGGAMHTSLDKGQYPDRTGSHQVFINTRPATDPRHKLPRPQSVVVVGLGEEGKLKPAQLVATVRQGVLAWAQRLSESGNEPTFDLAATLIGSGGIDMEAAQSAQLVVQGVLEANERLADGWGEDEGDPARPWPMVAHLSLIEIYLDRAAEAWRALRIAPLLAGRHYELHPVIESGLGALPRPIDSSYRGAPYDFIRAETQGSGADLSIAYTLDTKRARSESRPQPVQAALIENLVKQGAHHEARDLEIGRTLFQLLTPLEMKPYLTGNTDVQLEVDSGTAGIPWELLDTRTPGARDEQPWAIRTKLLRKLRMTEFRTQIVDASREDLILVIGEPKCNPKLYGRLPGALKEANAVAETFEHRSMSVRRIIRVDDDDSGPEAQTIISTVLGGAWRVVHIAGHGELPEDLSQDPCKASRTPNPRGVVLSDDIYLGPREIGNMPVVPELVFVNCCHLAARPKEQLLSPEAVERADRSTTARPRFASNVAEALIGIGVRCVVAAGWAVDDEPARVFAETFYDALIRGERFIDAAARARAAAFQPDSNTWGAYQCYGDPDWRLRPAEDRAERSAGDRPEFEQLSSSEGLVLALETIAVEINHQQRDAKERAGQIQSLVERLGERFAHQGRVAEAFGDAWAAVGDRKAALHWYKRALEANDGGASVHSAEQRANLEVRLAWETVEQAAKDNAADRAEVIAQARRDIDAAIELLQRLMASTGKSTERLSLLGSSYKRLALIAAVEHEEDVSSAEAGALKKMEAAYAEAETIGWERKLPDVYYPALNRIATRLARAKGRKITLDAEEVAAIGQVLESHADAAPNFWNVVGQIDLRVFKAVAVNGLAEALPGVMAAYDDLQRRIRQPWLWRSVSDQAEFVLRRYKPDASEQAAAETLRQQLRMLREVSAPPAVRPHRRRRRR